MRLRRIVVLDGDPLERRLLCAAAAAHGLTGIPAASIAAARAKLHWFHADGMIVDFDVGDWPQRSRLLRDLVVACVPVLLRTETVGAALCKVGLTAPVVSKHASHRDLFMAVADAIDKRRVAGAGWGDRPTS